MMWQGMQGHAVRQMPFCFTEWHPPCMFGGQKNHPDGTVNPGSCSASYQLMPRGWDPCQAPTSSSHTLYVVLNPTSSSIAPTVLVVRMWVQPLAKTTFTPPPIMCRPGDWTSSRYKSKQPNASFNLHELKKSPIEIILRILTAEEWWDGVYHTLALRLPASDKHLQFLFLSFPPTTGLNMPPAQEGSSRGWHKVNIANFMPPQGILISPFGAGLRSGLVYQKRFTSLNYFLHWPTQW